ncbi:E3 ubiquitin-protein ligase MBR2-like isoform X2 [Cynara cardunculus var. scolymus]|uniref:E3 ubiquitin-protein ligase MBR2-like isoform X2 n=1 Tax=Cynara cardunculus var. scolymus TaxID=59895 RepID=UPI000D6281C9|nr:E3 ubiquitin-protein ligase MBR2-like isoform X2 [Cynara cardunculus var. scolymus]
MNLLLQTTAPHNVTVNPSTSIGIKPSNHAETYVGSNTTSSTSFSNPLGRQLQLPSKRKAVELGQGSSSGVGSSSMFQRPEGSTSIWRSVTERSPPVNVMHSDQIIPRLGLGVPSDNHAVENTSRRNVRIRINASRQQDPLPLPATNNSNLQSNLSAPFPSLRLNPVDLRSSPPVATTVENSSSQPTLQLPALRRNLQVSSRWSRSLGSSRANRPANIDISGDYIRTNISDHPIFVQPNDIRNAAINWSLNGGGGIVGNNGNGDAASTRTRSNSVPAASSNLGPHRSSPSRRLSEIIRQSLLSSSIDSGGGGGQGSNLLSRIPPAAGTPSQVGRHHHLPHPRSSERQLDGAFGFPYLARSGAAGSEGRGRLVSEIRNVLDLIRRGEGLRFEDVMILDQSVFYGMGDRHRDMRLDIDNMSYEELLALEERIGSVNTGLTEETISGCLKQKTYATVPDAEPCCICQEDYKNGDDIGGLECGHDFHRSCIKKWLVQKNLCPVCKSAAIAATATATAAAAE